jgi:hypothetical protein
MGMGVICSLARQKPRTSFMERPVPNENEVPKGLLMSLKIKEGSSSRYFQVLKYG